MKLVSPWSNLPAAPPYILPEDLRLIQNHKEFSKLILDTYPEPFVGGLGKAKVVLLAKNPGYDPRDITVNMNSGIFKAKARANMLDPYGSEFYYYSDGIAGTFGQDWWNRILKQVRATGVTDEEIRHKMMCLEYFPYHSKEYPYIRTILPSQLYTFEILREAMRRNKLIIISRGRELWLRAVPELRQHGYIELSNPRNLSITPKTTGGNIYFKAIVQELKS